jgi:iduronate 2-sulfatase
MKNLFILFVLFAFGVASAASDKPNVLLILIDDLRPELGCYGAQHMVTPNLDQLASESILFDNAYTQQAVCLPSRISLFSGQYPQTTGVTTLQDKFWKLHENPVTLTRHLRENGYWAIGMGKVYHDEQWREWDDWTEMNNRRDGVFRNKYASPESIEKLKDLSKEAKEQGLKGKAFRQYVRFGPTEQSFGPDSNYHDYDLTDLAIERFEQRKDKDQPFFMTVGYRKPHLPFVAPKRFWDLYDREALELADNPSLPEGAPQIASMTWGELRAYKGVPQEGPVSKQLERELMHGYYACVSFVDEQVGRLIQSLKEQGLAEDTLVILWGDHGWKLGEHGMWCKHTNYEVDTRIPLMIRLPDGRQAGSVTKELTESIDLYPTICEFLGLPVPEQVEGDSVAYLFEDASAIRQEAAYSEYQRHGGVTGFSIKYQNFRYTEWIHLETGEIREREMYDHSVDPDENTNAASSLKHIDQLPTLSTVLHKGPAGHFLIKPD